MKFNLTANKILIISIVLLLLISSVILVISITEYQKVNMDTSWISDSEESILKTEGILNLISENENYVDNYQIEKKAPYLVAFNNSQKELYTQINKLKILVYGNPVQLARFDSLSNYVDRHFILSNQLISLLNSGAGNNLVLSLKNDEREDNLKLIRRLIVSIQTKENELLKSQKSTGEESIVRLTQILRIVIGCISLLIAILIIKIIFDHHKSKKLEEKLLIHEKEFRLLADNAQDLIFRYELLPTPHFSYISPSVTHLIGYTPEEHYADPNLIYKLIYEPDIPVFKSISRGEIKSGQISILRLVKKDHTIIWIELKNTPFFKDDGTIMAINGIARDITERVHSQEELKLAQLSYFEIFNTVSEAIYILDESGTFIDVNKGAEEMYHLSKEELIGITPFSLAAPGRNNMEEVKRMGQSVFETGKSVQFDFWALRKNGDIFLKEIIINKGKYFGKDVLIATARDITERIQSELKIRKINKKLEATLNAIPDLLFEVGIDGTIYNSHTNNSDLLAMPPSNFLGKTIAEILPPDVVEVCFVAMNEAAEKGYSLGQQYSLDLPHGKFWFELSAALMSDNDDSDKRLIFLARNITDRKNAENALKESEIKYRELVENSPDAIVIYQEGKIVFANKECLHLLRAENQEALIGKEVLKLVHEDYREFVKDRMKMVSSVGTNLPVAEEKVLRLDGSEVDVEIKAVSINFHNEISVQLIIHDITDRKKAQEEIIKQRDLSAAIIENLPGVFYICDMDFNLILWNKSVELVTGFNADEIAKMNVLDFVESNKVEAIKTEISQIFIDGKSSALNNIVLKSNEKIPYFFTGTMVEYKNQPAIMVMGIDFSERIQSQEKIKKTSEDLRKLASHLQTIREDERKRIAREIHDELGQQLTAMKMDVSWINKKIPDNDELVKTKLVAVLNMLDSTNNSVRRLLNELRPHILEDFGLLEALEWQAGQFTTNTGIPLDIIADKIEMELPDKISNCIFRVFQEALTNITRYAAATKVFSTLKIDNGNIILSIEDNGIGFDKSAVNHKKSFGITGIQERVLALNGKHELITAPGEGTKNIITLPIFE